MAVTGNPMRISQGAFWFERKVFIGYEQGVPRGIILSISFPFASKLIRVK